MHPKPKKDDRRSAKTIKALRRALTALILEKHYDLITVQDLIDRANVGRSTFYTHFRDKEDLFMGDWKRVLDGFLMHFNWDNIDEGRFVPIRELFDHLKDFHPFYRALIKSQKVERVFKIGLEYLDQNIAEKIAALTAGQPTNIPVPILANYLASEMFNLLRWWLDHNMPYPPEEMDKIFHDLVMPGFRNGFHAA